MEQQSMHVRILDLDGSISRQTAVVETHQPERVELREWGPRIRLGCRFGRFESFCEALPSPREAPVLHFLGSGDFHHVTLALLRQLTGPVNLLVLDNHPDWMRDVPLMHCGTGLYHATRLPQVRRIYKA